MTVEQIAKVLDSVPSVVYILPFLYFIFIVSMHDFVSRIFPAHSKKQYFFSVATIGIYSLGFLSRRTFLLQEIFQGLICSKSLKISLFILSSIVSLLVLLK